MRGRVGLDEPVLAVRELLDPRRGERRRELATERGVLGLELRALLRRAVEPQVQLQHGEVHEDDTGEQARRRRRSTRSPARECARRRVRASGPARLRLGLRPRRGLAVRSVGRRRDARARATAAARVLANLHRHSDPGRLRNAGCGRPRPRSAGSPAGESRAASASRRTRRPGSRAGRCSRARRRAGTA